MFRTINIYYINFDIDYNGQTVLPGDMIFQLCQLHIFHQEPRVLLEQLPTHRHIFHNDLHTVHAEYHTLHSKLDYHPYEKINDAIFRLIQLIILKTLQPAPRLISILPDQLVQEIPISTWMLSREVPSVEHALNLALSVQGKLEHLIFSKMV